MADMTDIAPACSRGSACCGRCTTGQNAELRDLLHEMQALGAVLPGQSPAPDHATFPPEPATGAGSGPWRG